MQNSNETKKNEVKIINGQKKADFLSQKNFFFFLQSKKWLRHVSTFLFIQTKFVIEIITSLLLFNKFIKHKSFLPNFYSLSTHCFYAVFSIKFCHFIVRKIVSKRYTKHSSLTERTVKE